MKKVLYFASLLLLAAFTSCEKEDIENTAAVNVAGQWYCTIDAINWKGEAKVWALDDDYNIVIDEKGDTVWASGEDYFGVGQTLILTYNTAGNNATDMWVDNMNIGNYAETYADYGFYPTYALKTKVSIDQTAMNFKSTESENFGAGYQWWEEQVKLDEKGDTIWADEDKTTPETENVMIHEEKAMPVSIEGKILKGAGRQNNGSPADSIVFFVTYKNDPWGPDEGFVKFRVSGIRFSGLVENGEL